jgi:branched-chain amino acid transport system substrate-binding protein
LSRHKSLHGLYGKTHIALAIGLCLWLCADIVWAVYEIVLETMPPIPSTADFLWLSAYGFLAYYLFTTYIEFHKRFRFNNRLLIASITVSAIFLSLIITLTLSLSDLSSPGGTAMFTIIIAYPILDYVLIVPAFVILINFRKEPLWFTPWICESAGIFLMAISDSWFALIVLTSLVEQFWLSALFFAAHYLVIAAGLLWYIKFMATRVYANNYGSKVFATTPSEFTFIDDNNNNNNHTLPKEKRRRIFGKAIITSIPIMILVAGMIVYSLYPFSFLLPFSSFAGINSELVIPAPDSKQTVTLGALLPLSGASSSLGESEEAALDVAIKDINQYFSKANSNTRIGVIIEDTKTNPIISLEKLKQLAAKGVRIVIGPATSAELQAVQGYANKNGILLISPSSTAPSLTIEDDNVFRFVPDDTYQAQAISRQMWNDGVRVVVPFWRTDVYGNNLVNAMKKNFEELGGTVIDGIAYKPHTGDFSSSLTRINFIIWDQALRSLESRLNQAISQYGANKVGVYLVAFDEVAPIFIQTQSHPILSTVKWYGSDGSAMNNKLLRNVEAARFAVKTGFPNPIYGVENDTNDRFKQIEYEIHEKIERTPRSYASVAYDIVWVSALTENYTKATNDTNYLKDTFVKIANSYKGITGNTSLNQAGDRMYGDFDFWAIKGSNNNDDDNNSDTFTWKRISKYVYDIRNKEGGIQDILSYIEKIVD